MCGIGGFLALAEGERAAKHEILKRMMRTLSHRGPDGEGYWQSADARVNLGHRRLAVIDLTAAGHQPMVTADRSRVISFNGEIYNFAELRAELAGLGATFSGASDTEVLLQSLVEWGIPAALTRLNGMFAFAYWDGQERKLWLVRDRFGEKPLYYTHIPGGDFLFGSELRALCQHPGFVREVDPKVLPSFLRFNYVPWPHCIYKNVHKLTPGHYIEVSLDGKNSEPKAYWRAFDTVNQREAEGRDARDPILIDDLDQVLTKAVSQRMVADVPLGAFLSGGIDSSLVVALMQKLSSRPVKTFTIGFWNSDYNEAEDAAKVARHLGTEHHDHYLSSEDCLGVIARLPEIYDEPFADSSQIPTTIVSEYASKHVTVVLSGDGGDEMFGGYNRYTWGKRIWPLLQAVPPQMRGFVRDRILQLSPAFWDTLFSIFNPHLPYKLRVRSGGDKLHKLAIAMGAKNIDALYRSFVSQWQNPGEALEAEIPELSWLLDEPHACPEGLNFVEKMMFFDQMTYLPSDTSCKVDRASMSTGLEARMPFLDNEVVRYSWSLPVSTKLYQGASKWPLRQVLGRYVPPKFFNRPKVGFGVPVGDWLRGPLLDWAEDLLSERSLADAGWFKVKVVRSIWADHLSGRRNMVHQLWSVLMFVSWKRRWIDSSRLE